MSVIAVNHALAIVFCMSGFLFKGIKMNVVGAIVLLGFGVLGVIFLIDIIAKRSGKKK